MPCNNNNKPTWCPGAGCGKPEFFIKRKPLFEVHTETGMLMNTDGGTPMVPIGEEDLPAPAYASSAPSIGAGGGGNAGRARVFQGGFFQDLHNMLDVSTGGEARAQLHTLLHRGGITLSPSLLRQDAPPCHRPACHAAPQGCGTACSAGVRCRALL